MKASLFQTSIYFKIMNSRIKNFVVFSLFSLLFLSCKESIYVVTAPETNTIEKKAATELSSYLSKIYPGYKFPIVTKQNKGKNIILKTVENEINVPDNKEGYLIKTDGNNVSILSKGSTGLLYGVYAMLEKLGCGFYMSDEMLPAPEKTFDFSDWSLMDYPLIKERYVFNWHNFLSGCSGWDKQQWIEWIDHSQKMGYNTVMIHAYHNNPLHTYEFNGMKKEVGYITTSHQGNEWGNIPVNDVRRIPGGEIFSEAVFGSDMALVTDDKRVEVAQSGMAEIIAYAQERGVNFNFGFDIDMPLSFLQNTLITSIPKEDMFYIEKEKVWVPRPDKAEGHKFYSAQLKGLFASYPMLKDITFFIRGQTFFQNAELLELPQEWQAEFTSLKSQNTSLDKLNKGKVLAYYITSKLVIGYQQVLKDMDKGDINLSIGSWGDEFVVPTALFTPNNIRLKPIDYDVLLGKSMIEDKTILADFASTNCEKRVVPFLWAHHDDGEYVGRPYKPTDNLYSKLEEGTCESFGVFHWMNRPFDLYLKGMIKQVWNSSKNQDFETTCTEMAKDYFGNESLKNYFKEWVNKAPIFGRATLVNLFHRPMKECSFNTDTAIAGCTERINILKNSDTLSMNQKQRAYIRYFKTLEQFIIDFSQTQVHFLKAEEYINAGHTDSARMEMQMGNPRKCVKTFAQLSQIVQPERSEMSYAIQFAHKYIADYLSFEQRLRLKPYRIKINPLAFDSLAQGASHLQYYIDPQSDYWRCYDGQILNANMIKISNISGLSESARSFEELFEYGVKIDTATTLPVRPVMEAAGIKNSGFVNKGRYALKLFIALEIGQAADFCVLVNGTSTKLNASQSGIISTEIEQTDDGLLNLKFISEKGDAYVCGLILDPIE